MILGELNFNQFVNQYNLRTLPINEQVRQYDFYIQNLVAENQRQNKGPGKAPDSNITKPYEGFLLQEDFDYLLQEEGYRIFL